MARFLNSLMLRIMLVCLFGMVALQATIFLAAIWPDDRPLIFRLIDPREAIEIARALEQAAPEQQALVLAAVSNNALRAELLPGFPDEPGSPGDLRPAPRLEREFARYAAELGGRAIRVQARGDAIVFARSPDGVPRGPVRLLVQLDTGQVLVIERVPRVLQTLGSRYLIVAGAVAVILALLLLFLFWQVVRPLSRLARATNAFREDMMAPDVREQGAGEIRELASAFNTMKQRIGRLIAERTRVLAAIAHDLRTYLTRLRLRAEYIDDPDQRDRAITDIDEMSQLLDDILLFARTDAAVDGELPVIELGDAVRFYVEMRQGIGDPVTMEAAEGTFHCRCAPLALRRILGNLVDNAIRFGNRAQVCLRADGLEAVITVEDRGPGVEEALVERLTAPFERQEPSRGRKGGGAGLGLAIVKAMAESHGGSLGLANRAEGGLRAEVRLPCVTQAPARRPAEFAD